MKRQDGLSRTSLPTRRPTNQARWLSPRRALPILGCLLAGITFAVASVLVLPGCASEMNGGSPPGGRMAPPQPEWPDVYEIITRLELEPEQVADVRAVLEEAEDAREELRGAMTAGMGGSRPDPSTMTTMREKADALNEDIEEQLSELLTSEQMDEYREIVREAEEQRQQMRPQMGVRGGPGGGPGGGRQGGGGW